MPQVMTDNVVGIRKRKTDWPDLPRVNLEEIRDFVNKLAPGRLAKVGADAWEKAKRAKGDEAVAYLYTLAYICSRIADEGIWERLPPA